MFVVDAQPRDSFSAQYHHRGIVFDSQIQGIQTLFRAQ